jgi:hypothetical protein
MNNTVAGDDFLCVDVERFALEVSNAARPLR